MNEGKLSGRSFLTTGVIALPGVTLAEMAQPRHELGASRRPYGERSRFEKSVMRYFGPSATPATGSSLSQSQLQLRMASLTGRSEEAYEAALRQALEELTEVHQDAFSFV